MTAETAVEMATPLVQEHFDRLYTTFGKKKADGRYEPIHHRLATHWARLVELLYASERMVELIEDPEILSPEVRTIPQKITGVGIGAVEAPRGTLTHHYETDQNGILTKVNLIVGTTNNFAPMTMSIKRAAEKFISKGKVVSDGILNRVEMAFRLHDPCLSCATHSLPGKMPMVVTIKNPDGSVVDDLRRC